MIKKIVIPTPFKVGDVNSYLLKGDVLSLIDVGPKTPEAYAALKSAIEEAGYSFTDIEQVILTHHHPDHSGWIDAFENAKVLGHVYNDMWLKRDEEFSRYHDEFYLERFIEEGVPEKYIDKARKIKRGASLMGSGAIDVALAEGDALPGHPGWTVIETPGHAQSHLVFWHEETGRVIGGDHVLASVSSTPLIEPPLNPGEERPHSLLQYNKSLKRILTLPVSTIYTGHGDEVYDAHSLIEERLVKQIERAMKVLTMMEKGPRTAFELTRELFPKAYEKALGLTLSETIGQTDYLVSEGYITETKEENGIFYFEKV